MDNYKIVKPACYTKEHLEYIDQFIDSTALLSSQTNIMFTIKDTDSKFITGTDTSAIKLGLNSGKNFMGKFTTDLPCESVAKFGGMLLQQEQTFINTCDVNKNIEALHVFEYTDGLRARLVTKRLFCHKPSASIIGVTGSAINVELRDFINIIPNYILRFGAMDAIESVKQQTNIPDVSLNEYEQEICFLFLLGWSFQQVADFMNIFRPIDKYRTADTIIKKKNYICHKLQISTTNLKSLCEYLFSIDMHKKMPKSFYSKIIGIKILD